MSSEFSYYRNIMVEFLFLGALYGLRNFQENVTDKVFLMAVPSIITRVFDTLYQIAYGLFIGEDALAIPCSIPVILNNTIEKIFSIIVVWNYILFCIIIS